MLVPILLLYAIAYPNSIVAQTAAEAGPFLTALNLGLAGVGLYMFATGKIVAQGTLTKCEEKLDAAEEQLRRIAAEDRSVLVPALTRATDVLTQYLEKRTGDTPPPPNRRVT